VKHGKRYQSAVALLGPQRTYSLDEAIEKLKALATSSFDETAEAAFNMGIKATQVVGAVLVHCPMERARQSVSWRSQKGRMRPKRMQRVLTTWAEMTWQRRSGMVG